MSGARGKRTGRRGHVRLWRVRQNASGVASSMACRPGRGKGSPFVCVCAVHVHTTVPGQKGTRRERGVTGWRCPRGVPDRCREFWRARARGRDHGRGCLGGREGCREVSRVLARPACLAAPEREVHASRHSSTIKRGQERGVCRAS